MTNKMKTKKLTAGGIFIAIFITGIILLFPAIAIALFSVKLGIAVWMMLMFINIFSFLKGETK